MKPNISDAHVHTCPHRHLANTIVAAATGDRAGQTINIGGERNTVVVTIAAQIGQVKQQLDTGQAIRFMNSAAACMPAMPS